MSAVIEAVACSKWYPGNVLGISDITWSLGGGIVGLLGRARGAGAGDLEAVFYGALVKDAGCGACGAVR